MTIQSHVVLVGEDLRVGSHVVDVDVNLRVGVQAIVTDNDSLYCTFIDVIVYFWLFIYFKFHYMQNFLAIFAMFGRCVLILLGKTLHSFHALLHGV